jgi:nucleotide-binding universal stress UspA family protein
MAWEWPVTYGWSAASTEHDPGLDCEGQLGRALEPIVRAHPHLSVQSVAIEGSPAALLAKASSGADLVAVGSRGHREVAGLMLGSVSEYVVVHARSPVLVHHRSV